MKGCGDVDVKGVEIPWVVVVLSKVICYYDVWWSRWREGMVLRLGLVLVLEVGCACGGGWMECISKPRLWSHAF